MTAPVSAPGASKSVAKVAVTTSVASKRVVPVSNPLRAASTSPQPIARTAVAISATPVLKKVPVAAPVKPSIPKPAPPEPGYDDQGEYDLADDVSQLDSLLPDPDQIAAAGREVPAILAAQPVAAEPLAYHRPLKEPKSLRENRIDPETGELYADPIREYIAPGILFALSFAGIAAFVMQKLGSGPLADMAMSIAFVVLIVVTIIKTSVLIAAAVPISSYCDVSVGLLRTAILKLGSTIMFGEIALLWLVVFLQNAGMVPKKSDGGLEMWPIYVVVMTLVYHGCFAYMFRIPWYDVKFAALIGICSRVCNFLMEVILVALLTSIALNRMPAQAPMANVPVHQLPPMIPMNAPMTAQPGQNQPTAFDDMISQHIHQSSFHVMEGYAWCRTGMANDADKKLVSDLYNAGADKVYVEGFTIYAQLPGDPTKRSACLDVAHAHRKKNGMLDDAALNSLNYQYVVIDVMGNPFMGMRHH